MPCGYSRAWRHCHLKAAAPLFVAGSHRLAQSLIAAEGARQMRSADARKALIRNYPWMKDLCSRDGKTDRVQAFMNSSGAADEVEVRVVEMTGEAGDVLLVHPLMLHAPAKNCAATPRLVLSSVVFRCGVSSDDLYR
jgi:ectoine hydroxylase-related dioxygenase (phytanoyl-CoA dioxygenase family)